MAQVFKGAARPIDAPAINELSVEEMRVALASMRYPTSCAKWIAEGRQPKDNQTMQTHRTNVTGLLKGAISGNTNAQPAQTQTVIHDPEEYNKWPQFAGYCPSCNKGTLTKKPSKFPGSACFYGCDNFPTCKFYISSSKAKAARPELFGDIVTIRETAKAIHAPAQEPKPQTTDNGLVFFEVDAPQPDHGPEIHVPTHDTPCPNCAGIVTVRDEDGKGYCPHCHSFIAVAPQVNSYLPAPTMKTSPQAALTNDQLAELMADEEEEQPEEATPQEIEEAPAPTIPVAPPDTKEQLLRLYRHGIMTKTEYLRRMEAIGIHAEEAHEYAKDKAATTNHTETEGKPAPVTETNHTAPQPTITPEQMIAQAMAQIAMGNGKTLDPETVRSIAKGEITPEIDNLRMTISEQFSEYQNAMMEYVSSNQTAATDAKIETHFSPQELADAIADAIARTVPVMAPQASTVTVQSDNGQPRTSGTNAAIEALKAQNAEAPKGAKAAIHDKSFVIPPTAAELFKACKARRASNLPIRPILLFGPAGCGKTEMAKELAAFLQYPLFSINCATVRETSHWFGRTIAAEASTYYVMSEFIKWVEHGEVLILLDEITRAVPSVLNALMSLMDGQRSVWVDEVKRTINVGPNCCFVATANIGASYSGTFTLDKAIKSRLIARLRCDYLEEAQEINLLVTRTGIAQSDARKLVRTAGMVRRAYNAGTLSESIDTRTLIGAAELFKEMGSTALEVTIYTLFDNSAGANSEEAQVRQIAQGQGL